MLILRSVAQRGVVLSLLAATLGFLLSGNCSHAETPPQNSSETPSFDILNISIGMHKPEVAKLLKARMEAGKAFGFDYELKEHHESSYDRLDFKASRSEPEEATHLSVYFSTNETTGPRAVLIYRRDKITPIDKSVLYASLTKKYGSPTFENADRSELSWIEHGGKECLKGLAELLNMDAKTSSECGARFVISLGPDDSIESLEMVLR